MEIIDKTLDIIITETPTKITSYEIEGDKYNIILKNRLKKKRNLEISSNIWVCSTFPSNFLKIENSETQKNLCAIDFGVYDSFSSF